MPTTPTKQRRPSRSSPAPEDAAQQCYDEAQQRYDDENSQPCPQIRSPSRGRTAQLRGTGAAAATPNRISMMSVSSNSTKLGEIPEHKWRSNYNTLAVVSYSSEGYNVAPAYPLKPYLVREPKAKPSFFGGLFGRKRRV